MRKTTSVNVLFTLAALAFVLLSAFTVLGGDPAAAGKKGPFEVGFTTYTLTDTTRPGAGDYKDRPIPVFVWYPVDSNTITASSPEAVYPLDIFYPAAAPSLSSQWEARGMDRAYQEPPPSSQRPFPLLLFSPGWGGPPYFHMSVGARLASHGFVVAVLYHFGDCFFMAEPACDPLAVATLNRPLDLKFTLTDILQRNQTPGNLLAGTIRPDLVAAGGWSLGGYAAESLSAGDDMVCDTLYGSEPTEPPGWTCVPAAPDPRFKAMVSLDGSSWIFHFNEMARARIPYLGIGQEWEVLAQSSPGFESWHARAHAAFDVQPSYRVDVANTNHQSFSNLCEWFQIMGDLGYWLPEWVDGAYGYYCASFTPRSEINRIVGQYLIAFLKANLARDPGYQPILTPGWALTRETAVEFFVTEKKSPNSIRDDWPVDFTYFPHQSGGEQAKALKNPPTRPPVPKVRSPH